MSNHKSWPLFTGATLLWLAGGPSLADSVELQDKDKPKPAAKLIDQNAKDAIYAGLEFLASNQHADGSWGTGTQKGSIAVTGLGGLAFLAGGHKPGEGKYGKNITLALKYVLDHEDPRGFLHHQQAQLYGPMYGHGFGTLFLAEAKGKVNDPNLSKKLDGTLSRAVKLIIDIQNNEGGWRYQPVARDADISVTSVQVMALQAASKAGLEVPKEVKEKYVKYVKSCQDAGSGGFRYQSHDGRTGFARTAAGIISLQGAGERDSAEVKKGLEFLKTFQPQPPPKERIQDAEVRIHYFYGHYYTAKAMQIAGGDRWRTWFPAVRDDLITHSGFKQADGSWNDRTFCPHYCTAMALLILQTPLQDAKLK